MKRARLDWIVFDTRDGGSLWCQRCDDHYMPRYPVLLSLIGAMVKAFEKDHARCKERKP